MKKWVAIDWDGTLIDENMVNWDKVKGHIKQLWLEIDGRKISLPPDMPQYIQGKTASAFIGSDKVTIESRFIGFVKNNVEFKLRVDEKTNNISIEVTNK